MFPRRYGICAKMFYELYILLCLHLRDGWGLFTLWPTCSQAIIFEQIFSAQMVWLLCHFIVTLLMSLRGIYCNVVPSQN